jgi:hypothetical protein
MVSIVKLCQEVSNMYFKEFWGWLMLRTDFHCGRAVGWVCVV